MDGKTPGLFQLAHTKSSAFLSVRALFPKASANLNIRWNDQTYVFDLIESDQPVLSRNLEAPPTPEEDGVGRAPEVSPIKLLSLLDKAKAFPLLKAQQPESVADVDFTTTTASRSSAISTTTKSRLKKLSVSTPRTRWSFVSPSPTRLTRP